MHRGNKVGSGALLSVNLNRILKKVVAVDIDHIFEEIKDRLYKKTVGLVFRPPCADTSSRRRLSKKTIGLFFRPLSQTPVVVERLCRGIFNTGAVGARH